MTLSDLEKLDQASQSLIAGQSQSFWLWSSLLAQLRDDGFKPADTNLFVQTITTLSASLASQTNLSSGMSVFVTSKRRESYLAHTSCPVGESVKRELLVAPGPNNLWLIQPLREKVVCTIKEALLLLSTVHRFSRFQFYCSLSRSFGSLRRRRVCFSTCLFEAQHIGLSQRIQLL